jgi:hypothetical protein
MRLNRQAEDVGAARRMTMMTTNALVGGMRKWRDAMNA